MNRFEDKVVLITGGAGSIGWAAAQRFAAEGAKIVLADLSAERAASLAKTLPHAIGIAADVTDKSDAMKAVDQTILTYGRIDVLFNNAGISGPVCPVHELEVEQFDHVMRTNLRSQFLMLQAAAKAMIAAKSGGSIVNMGSSMAGWDVLSGSPGYLASKHAVIGLTKSAALDLAGYGIRVNAICPGVIETSLGVPAANKEAHIAAVRRFADRIPLRRIGLPQDVAAAVAFLASNDACHITGSDYLIDGGQTMVSWANGPESAAWPDHLREE